MAADRQTATSLPRGFSVFQPALGAQLQFFPAVGTQELDDMINAYIPGNNPIQEKRASVSLDFLEYSRMTGQAFKFYTVYSLSPALDSSTAASPLQDSGYNSSFNASPVTSTWDWSQASPATTSQPSTSRRQSRQSPRDRNASRHRTNDFSHLPGMKIMTKDGRDVTNSASRGSKTKEQRDHAHLMRIIKACDSCRRKKIRCDPSHKKRGVSSQTQSQSTSKPAKKARTASQETRTPAPIILQEDFAPLIDTFSANASFATGTSLDVLDSMPLSSCGPWDEFVQYPPDGVAGDYDFFTDPEGYLSPLSSSSASASPFKPVTPNSQQGLLQTSSSLDVGNVEPALASPLLPYDQYESGGNYVDFNLFSPQSSFSEDDRMVPIELYSNQITDQHAQPSMTQCPQLNYSPFSSEDYCSGSDSSTTNLAVSPLSIFNGNDDYLAEDHAEYDSVYRHSSHSPSSGQRLAGPARFDGSTSEAASALSFIHESGTNHENVLSNDIHSRLRRHLVSSTTVAVEEPAPQSVIVPDAPEYPSVTRSGESGTSSSSGTIHREVQSSPTINSVDVLSTNTTADKPPFIRTRCGTNDNHADSLRHFVEQGSLARVLHGVGTLPAQSETGMMVLENNDKSNRALVPREQGPETPTMVDRANGSNIYSEISDNGVEYSLPDATRHEINSSVDPHAPNAIVAVPQTSSQSSLSSTSILTMVAMLAASIIVIFMVTSAWIQRDVAERASTGAIVVVMMWWPKFSSSSQERSSAKSSTSWADKQFNCQKQNYNHSGIPRLLSGAPGCRTQNLVLSIGSWLSQLGGVVMV